MEKGFSVPIILAGLLILIFGGYFLLSYFHKNLPIISSNPPAGDKQTYTNQLLGFEFAYKKDLKLKEDSEEEFHKRGSGNFRKNFKGYVGYEPGKFVSGAVVLGEDNSYDQNPFTLWVFQNDNNLTIEQWYANYWYYPFVWGDFTSEGKVKLAPKIEATVSGQMGKAGMVDYQPGKPKFVYVISNGKMYLFRIIGETGEKVLSDFKFIHQGSGIMGKATRGPTCPGPQRVGDVCAKPYQGEVIVKNQDKTKEVTRFTTGNDGSFKISLSPGEYYLLGASNNNGTFLKERLVKVESNQFTKIDLNFDTGIR